MTAPLSGLWQEKLRSPLVQDTLRELLGGTLPVFAGSWRGAPEPDIAGQFVAPDTVKLYDRQPSDDVLFHELGHVFDARNLAPLETNLITAQPATHGYAATSADEHVAEAFRRAVQSMRKQYADSTEADADVPGTRALIRWMIGRARKNSPSPEPRDK